MRFTSPELKEANTELQQLQETYNSLQSTLAAEVLKVAGEVEAMFGIYVIVLSIPVGTI